MSARLLTLLLVLPATVLAASPSSADLRDELAACRAVPEADARLACYDALVDVPPPASSVVIETTPAPDTAAKGAVTATGAEEDFGLEYAVKDAPQSLTSTVTEVSRNARGGLVLHLANDQVWQQAGSERLFIREGQAVILRRGALSAFYLSTSENGRRYRFSRVR